MSDNIAYDSWFEFKRAWTRDLFEDGVFRRGRYIFRGQSNFGWDLSSSLDRELDKFGIEERVFYDEELRNIFNFLLDEDFETEYHDFSEIERLALAQHYGLPTRLLDWTESIYVAAFFAYEGHVKASVDSSRIAIWVLDSSCDAFWSESVGVKVEKVGRRRNLRMRNQEGLFTIQKTPYRSLEEHVDTIRKSRGERNLELQKPLIQISIPAGDKAYALADLDAMKISYRTMFPELFGLTAEARHYVRRKFEIDE